MNIQTLNLIYFKPIVAILDDDKEFIQDLSLCLNKDDIDLVGFTSIENFKNEIRRRYNLFINTLNTLMLLLKEEKIQLDKIEHYFQTLISNRPYSVALIDLNLNQSHEHEGFEICENLLPFSVKTIIYSGSDVNELSLSLINQGIIFGQLNKSNDIFEEVVPSIHSAHKSFLNIHFNITHLLLLRNNIKDINIDHTSTKIINENNNFLIYDEFFNHLII